MIFAISTGMSLHLTILSIFGFFARLTGKPVIYAFGYAYMILVVGLLGGSAFEAQFWIALQMFAVGMVLFGLLHRARKNIFAWAMTLIAGTYLIEHLWSLRTLIQGG